MTPNTEIPAIAGVRRGSLTRTEAIVSTKSARAFDALDSNFAGLSVASPLRRAGSRKIAAATAVAQRSGAFLVPSRTRLVMALLPVTPAGAARLGGPFQGRRV